LLNELRNEKKIEIYNQNHLKITKRTYRGILKTFRNKRTKMSQDIWHVHNK